MSVRGGLTREKWTRPQVNLHHECRPIDTNGLGLLPDRVDIGLGTLPWLMKPGIHVRDPIAIIYVAHIITLPISSPLIIDTYRITDKVPASAFSRYPCRTPAKLARCD